MMMNHYVSARSQRRVQRKQVFQSRLWSDFYSYEEFKNCSSFSRLLSLSRSAASLRTFSLICSKRKVPQVKSGPVAICNE